MAAAAAAAGLLVLQAAALGVEDDELGPDLAGAPALEQRHQAAQVLYVEGVAVGRLAGVAEHRAVETAAQGRWPGDEATELAGLGDAAARAGRSRWLVIQSWRDSW